MEGDKTGNLEKLIQHLLGKSERAFAIQSALAAIPALGPENGGQGEAAKAVLVASLLASAGITDLQRLDSPDSRVESGIRPNIIARVAGKKPKTLWLFGHLDVVPPGQGWETDPWTVCRVGDKITGRGVEDNQQAVTSMLLLAEALFELKLHPELSLGLVFMADEECGSMHGLKHILDKAPELFSPDDYYLVPDGGSPDGASIEIAEKAQLWLKVTVTGKQCHASAPQNGINAFAAACRLVVALDGLQAAFPESDDLFAPPISTFTPTRIDGNEAAINILPGKASFYLDCRLLPGISHRRVLEKITAIAGEVAAQTGAGIELATVQRQAASAVAADSPLVARLMKAIARIYAAQARPCGIGGATVAALLRERGLPAAVWSCILNTCHQPNESSSLLAACRDAAVFASILQGEDNG